MHVDADDPARVDEAGRLVIGTGARKGTSSSHLRLFRESAMRPAVDGAFRIGARGDVRFNVSSYDRTRTLSVDPVITFSTYIGSSNYDDASDLAVDAAGRT